MALIQSGALGRLPAVNECWADPLYLRELGVEAVHTVRVDGKEEPFHVVRPVEVNGTTFKYYRHPELFVSDTVKAWHKEYKAVKRHGTKREYNDFHPCFLQAEELYESYLNGEVHGK